MRYVGMGSQHRAAALAEAGNNVADARRETRLGNQASKGEQRRRRAFGRLHHQRTARRQRRADLHRGEKKLAVPGNDCRHDAYRLAPRPGFGVGLVDAEHAPFHLVGQPGVVAVIVGDIGDLRPGFADDFAGVERFQPRQLVSVLFDQIRQPHQQLAAH